MPPSGKRPVIDPVVQAQADYYVLEAGKMITKHKDYKLAETLVSRGIELVGARSDYILALGSIHAGLGQYDEALKHIDNLIAFDDSSELYKQARVAVLAQKELAQKPQAAPEAADVETQIADYAAIVEAASKQYDDYDMAFAVQQRICELAPGDEAHKNALESIQDDMQAKRYADLAQNITGAYSDYAATVSLMEQAVILNSTHAGYRHMLGVTYYHMGQYDKAVDVQNGAVALEASVEAYEQALEVMKAAQGTEPKVTPASIEAAQVQPLAAEYNRVANKLVEMFDDHDVTVSLRRRAVALDGDNAEHAYNLAYALYDETMDGKGIPSKEAAEEVLPHLKKAVEALPESYGINNMLAIFSYAANDPDAVGYYQKLVSLDDQSHVAWNNLAQALTDVTGDKQAAAEAYAKAIALAPDEAIYQQHLADLGLQAPVTPPATTPAPQDPPSQAGGPA